MKISLIEAKKLATPGNLTADTKYLNTERGNTIAEVYASGDMTCQRDAALLAHRWNTHDELVEALEDLAFDAGRVERKFSEGRDWAEWRDLRDKLNALKPLLARAKTVEMP